MADVKQPVKAIDPTTTYYGQQKFNGGTLKKTVDDAYATRDGNLLAADSSRDRAGSTNAEYLKKQRLDAMARRAGKVY